MAPFHTCRLENKSRKSETIPAFKIPKRPYGSPPPPLQCALYALFTKKSSLLEITFSYLSEQTRYLSFFFLKQIWNQCVANVATRLDGTVTLSKLVKFPTYMVMPLVLILHLQSKCQTNISLSIFVMQFSSHHLPSQNITVQYHLMFQVSVTTAMHCDHCNGPLGQLYSEHLDQLDHPT